MNYKKNSLIFLTILIFLLITIGTFNYILDPVGLYRPNRYEYGIAKILLSGKNVANVGDYEDRLMNKFYIENMKYKPKIIVIGSSRSFFISSKNNKNEFFNTSVTGASLVDLVSFYDIYKNKGIHPKTIIICADPWLLNKHEGEEDSHPLRFEYYNMLNQLNYSHNNSSMSIDGYFIKKVKELISMPYFLASWKKFRSSSKQSNNSFNYYPTDKQIDENYTIKKHDGSLSYSIKYNNVSVAEANEKTRKFVNNKMDVLLGDFKDLKNVDIFESVVNDMQKNKITVILFLAPYHPYMYSVIEKNSKYHNVINTEHYFRDFAKKNKIKIYGSYNPKQLNLSEKDFYDGAHLKEISIKKLNILDY